MVIGIDLGTTNTCAAYINKDGKAEVIAEEYGNTIPSAVSMMNSNTFCVGKAARERALRAPEETVISAKRLIGKQWHEAAKTADRYGMKLTRGPNGEPIVYIDGTGYTVETISAAVLTSVKLNAEKKLGKKVTSAVITVPAYFNDSQRNATVRAGEIAGLDVEAIISEPTAAALAYDKEGLIAVYDFGGGTFDISVVRKEGGKTETVATGGDLHLGGDDIDDAIMKTVIRKAETELHVKILDDEGKPADAQSVVMIQRIRNVAEKLKISLCENGKDKEETVIRNLWGDVSLRVSLTQGQLRQIMKPFVDRSIKCCSQALADAGISVSDLDSVVLVGGTTKSPYVRARVEEFFGMEPDTSLNPDEAVALGAALSVDLRSRNSFRDVTPLNLFLETADGKGSVLIRRNTPVPAEALKGFTTSRDDQTAINFVICQGDDKRKIRLGTMIMADIAKGKAGEAKIAVSFRISESGILTVRAMDMATGKVQRLDIKRSFA